jgi:hypothetical protein
MRGAAKLTLKGKVNGLIHLKTWLIRVAAAFAQNKSV